MTRINPIISTKEARKLLGNEAKEMTDEQIEQLIEDLDVIARYSLEQVIKQRKEDAMLLARLIYDVYKEG